jgi:ATP-binding cassette, subfamily C, bacterial
MVAGARCRGRPMPDSPAASAWHLARRAFHGRSGRILLVTVLSLVNGFAQGAIILLLVPMLRAAGVPVDAASTVGGLDRVVSAAFMMLGLTPTLSVVLVAFVAIAWLQASIARWQIVEEARIEQDVEHELRTELYAAMVAARWSFFTNRRSRDLAHAITRDSDRAAVTVAYLLSAGGQAVSVVVYLAFALAISPTATVTCIAGGMGLMLALRGTLRTAHATGTALSDASADTLAVVSEHVDAIKLVKAYGAEQRTLAAFDGLADRSARVAVTAARTYAGGRGATAAGAATLLAFVVFVALRWLRLPVAAMLVLVFLVWRLLPRLMDVQQTLRDAIHELPGYETVQRTLAECVAAREIPVATRSGGRSMILRDSLRFDRLSFAYDGGPAVLRPLEASVPAMKWTAITGPSGAGKTTLADLVLGLLRPTAGRILLDGVPLADAHIDDWRKAVAYVPQEPLLFHDSIAMNLQWAQPDATAEDMASALRQADADEFVRRLPDGLDTVVGDRGVRLSGGERQRLALARALLRHPTLLVLDEATSALDAESETRILRAIGALRGSTTVLLVTHRAAPLRHADVIYLLRDGLLRLQPADAVYP